MVQVVQEEKKEEAKEKKERKRSGSRRDKKGGSTRAWMCTVVWDLSGEGSRSREEQQQVGQGRRGARAADSGEILIRTLAGLYPLGAGRVPRGGRASCAATAAAAHERRDILVETQRRQGRESRALTRGADGQPCWGRRDRRNAQRKKPWGPFRGFKDAESSSADKSLCARLSRTETARLDRGSSSALARSTAQSPSQENEIHYKDSLHSSWVDVCLNAGSLFLTRYPPVGPTTAAAAAAAASTPAPTTRPGGAKSGSLGLGLHRRADETRPGGRAQGAKR